MKNHNKILSAFKVTISGKSLWIRFEKSQVVFYNIKKGMKAFVNVIKDNKKIIVLACYIVEGTRSLGFYFDSKQAKNNDIKKGDIIQLKICFKET